MFKNTHSLPKFPREPVVFHPARQDLRNCCCCLGKAQRAQLLKKSAWLLHLIGNKAPPAARDSNEVAGTLNQRCYPYTEKGRYSWCESSSLSLSIELFTQDEAMVVIRSTPQGVHYHADVDCCYCCCCRRRREGFS